MMEDSYTGRATVRRRGQLGRHILSCNLCRPVVFTACSRATLTWSYGSCHTPSRALSCCSGCKPCRRTCCSPGTAACCWPGTWKAADSRCKASLTAAAGSRAAPAWSPPFQSWFLGRCRWRRRYGHTDTQAHTHKCALADWLTGTCK